MQTHQKEALAIQEKSEQQAEIKKYPRLPCRGCLASCKNYQHCDGKLWRMAK